MLAIATGLTVSGIVTWISLPSIWTPESYCSSSFIRHSSYIQPILNTPEYKAVCQMWQEYRGGIDMNLLLSLNGREAYSLTEMWNVVGSSFGETIMVYIKNTEF